MRRLLPTLLLVMMVFTTVPTLAANEEGGCAETAAKVDALSSKVSRDMRRIQRELAALKAQIEQPGLNEIFSGVGYITGLFGVAFFVAGRRKKE